jgi:hypothetical protein
MQTPPRNAVAFGDRYAIESLSSGDGVLVDLQTGNFFRLNSSAVAACRALAAAATLDEAIDRLAAEVGASSDRAADFMTSIRHLLAQPGIRVPAPGPYHYAHETEDLCTFSQDSRRIFAIHRRQKTVELCISPSSLGGPLDFYVRAILPKLLALLDVPILHGAACCMGESFVAFCGLSGAGKTTTARAFRDAGARIVSEDLLVLSLGHKAVEVFEDGERLARAWVADAAVTFSDRGEVDYSELAAAVRGAKTALATIWFLDEGRRLGDRFDLRPLTPIDGLLLLLGNGFLATAEAASWRAFLRRSAQIAESARMSAATVPAGLQNLATAATDYKRNSAA